MLSINIKVINVHVHDKDIHSLDLEPTRRIRLSGWLLRRDITVVSGDVVGNRRVVVVGVVQFQVSPESL